ncbi:MAG: DUF84 family protein [Chloroflexi bacterium]|nr:DUF84 family protein [Chloroflexota bacterium]
MKIAVGSENPVKIAAARSVLWRVYGEQIDVEAVRVMSGVSDQPYGNEETLCGAVGRSRAALHAAHAELGIGFEGGIIEVSDRSFTCAWCVVTRRDGVVGIAGGENLLLPESVAAAIYHGDELGVAMDRLTRQRDTKRGAGAIGLLTGGLLDRQRAYEHLLELALARFLTPELYEA